MCVPMYVCVRALLCLCVLCVCYSNFSCKQILLNVTDKKFIYLFSFFFFVLLFNFICFLTRNLYKDPGNSP